MSVTALIQSSQMRASDLKMAEDQAMKDLAPADVATRQAELRRTRDLMFRAERKAKRVAKIKSKTFRRIRKKEKQRRNETEDGALDLAMMQELDDIDGGGRVAVESERLDALRAKERVTLKYSSGGRWAQSVKVRLGFDPRTLNNIVYVCFADVSAFRVCKV